MIGFVALPGADILNQTHFFRWSKISLKLDGYRAFSKQEQGRGEMREGEHNGSKESKFSRQYLSLHWHQIFFSGSVETQESAPRGVLRLSFAWLSLGRQEGGGKFYGTNKLEEVGDGLKIGIQSCQCVYLISTLSYLLYSQSSLPFPQTDIHDTLMAISAATLYIQGSLSSPAAGQLWSPKPRGTNWSEFSGMADPKCKFGFCYHQTLILSRSLNFSVY